MKKLFIISWTFFAIGILFKLFHILGTGLALALGAILLFLYSIIYFAKNIKNNLVNSIFNLSLSFWVIYLFFRIQYWDNSQLVFLIAFLTTITWLVLNHRINKSIKKTEIFYLIFVVFCITLSFVHSHSIHYFFRLNNVINKESRNVDYLSWDKYSWFLYISSEHEKALNANQNAKKAVSEYLKSNLDSSVVEYTKLIEYHEQQILKKNWTQYP